jgi:hypothetical protein
MRAQVVRTLSKPPPELAALPLAQQQALRDALQRSGEPQRGSYLARASEAQQRRGAAHVGQRLGVMAHRHDLGALLDRQLDSGVG